MRVRSIATIALALALAPFGLAGCAQPAASTTAASNASATNSNTESNGSAAGSEASNTSTANGSAAGSASSTTSEAANPSPGASASSVAPGSPTGATEITPDQAIQIALEHANLTEADVYDLKVELERDDNMPHYDVEFKRDNVEYDYEILLDGTILTANSEIDDDAAR